MKKKYELEFTTDGSERELKAIKKVEGLVLSLIAITNGESTRERWQLKAVLKEK